MPKPIVITLLVIHVVLKGGTIQGAVRQVILNSEERAA